MQAVSKRWGISGSSVRCPSSFTNLRVKKPILVEGCWEDTSEFLIIFFSLDCLFSGSWQQRFIILWSVTLKSYKKKKKKTEIFGVFVTLTSPVQLSSALSSFPNCLCFHQSQMLPQIRRKPQCPSMLRSVDNIFLGLPVHFLSTVFFLCSCLCSSWAFCALYREANPASTLHYL